ncbi:MAG TPA: hypothetical protein VM925_30790 [Labilithrix sp.]|jgi:hypothetical protein|nr:hypothetical protein [Labilithrix sp.]
MTTHEARAISVSIARDWRAVYEFCSVPTSFREWASGLGGSLRNVDGRWTAEGPGGPVTVRFSDRNDFGVLDHWVTLDSGAEIYIPLRVVQNGTGAEVTFTLFRLPGVTDEALEADTKWVERDLAALKSLLEAKPDRVEPPR